tara:strand:- start:351 stop:1070 length:720 start_codon:yes stop_codon:yes gene_type:complete
MSTDKNKKKKKFITEYNNIFSFGKKCGNDNYLVIWVDYFIDWLQGDDETDNGIVKRLDVKKNNYFLGVISDIHNDFCPSKNLLEVLTVLKKYVNATYEYKKSINDFDDDESEQQAYEKMIDHLNIAYNRAKQTRRNSKKSRKSSKKSRKKETNHLQNLSLRDLQDMLDGMLEWRDGYVKAGVSQKEINKLIGVHIDSVQQVLMKLQAKKNQVKPKSRTKSRKRKLRTKSRKRKSPKITK